MLGRKRAESGETLKKQRGKYIEEANAPEGNT